MLIEGVFLSTFDVNNLQTYLINLKHRNDKYLASKFQLDILGLNFSTFEAVNGPEIMSDLKRNGSDSNLKNMTGIEDLKVSVDSMLKSSSSAAQTGCWLSHLKLHQIISKSEDENKMHLIFEDDFLADGSAIDLIKISSVLFQKPGTFYM